VILGALSSFGPLSIDLYLPGLPSLTRDLNASASAAQLTLTGCMLGIALGQLIAGPVSDRFGRRVPLLTGLTGFTLASLACAVMPSIWPLVGVRFIQGLVGGVGIVIARAVVRDLFGGVTAARLFATLMAITGIAPVLAPILGAQILRFTSWRGAFVALAIVGLGMLAMATFGLQETLPADRRHEGGLAESLRIIRGLSADRSFAPYALALALASCAMFAYIAGSSYVLENVFRTSPQVFSAVFAVNSLGFISVAQVGGRSVGRFGPARLLRWGLFALLVASLGTLAVALVGTGLWPVLVCLFVLMSSMGLVLPNATAAAMVGQPTALGAASALIGLGQFGVGALVVPLVGIAGADDMLPMAVIMGAGSAAAVLVDLVFAHRPTAS
jgi:MFS transporter, DHA1 family, multidrug resistance protein